MYCPLTFKNKNNYNINEFIFQQKTMGIYIYWSIRDLHLKLNIMIQNFCLLSGKSGFIRIEN
jgi:hypothetical protein